MRFRHCSSRPLRGPFEDGPEVAVRHGVRPAPFLPRVQHDAFDRPPDSRRRRSSAFLMWQGGAIAHRQASIGSLGLEVLAPLLRAGFPSVANLYSSARSIRTSGLPTRPPIPRQAALFYSTPIFVPARSRNRNGTKSSRLFLPQEFPGRPSAPASVCSQATLHNSPRPAGFLLYDGC